MPSHLSEENVDLTDVEKKKVENYGIDEAINELHQIMDESSEMYYQLKKVKFDYIVQICELYSRIDFPSIMIEACRKEVTSSVPKASYIKDF